MGGKGKGVRGTILGAWGDGLRNWGGTWDVCFPCPPLEPGQSRPTLGGGRQRPPMPTSRAHAHTSRLLACAV